MTPLEAVLSPDGWPYASSQPIDRDDPGRFHALFGRDSLITSLQVLPERPDVARATLRALAELQGTVDDPDTDEEPGKIVHEYRPQADKRFEDMGWPIRNGELRYYGSADGTSWFLVVLDALGDDALTEELSSAWRAAAQWLERALERGRGMVRYGPAAGLVAASSSRAGATPPTPSPHTGAASSTPMGACPSRRSRTPTPRQPRSPRCGPPSACRATPAGSRSPTARSSGSPTRSRPRRWRSATATGASRARARRSAGCCGPTPCRTRSATRYADRLCEPDVLTDFGLRTLSSEHLQFAPEAYHRGAAWPFDSWLGWGGLRASGRDDRGRADPPGRARGPRDAGRRARAVRGHRRRAAADTDRQPRAGVDDRRAGRATAQLGRAATGRDR